MAPTAEVTATHITIPTITATAAVIRAAVCRAEGVSPVAVPVVAEAFPAVAEAVDIPVVAIGGINKNRLEPLKGTGVDGVAVVSAIFAAEDIEKATRELKEAVREIL